MNHRRGVVIAFILTVVALFSLIGLIRSKKQESTIPTRTAVSDDAGKFLAPEVKSVSPEVEKVSAPVENVHTDRVVGVEASKPIIGKKNPNGSVTFKVPLSRMTFEGVEKTSK